MKNNAEDNKEELEGYYRLFESLINSTTSPDSHQTRDVLSAFLRKPTSLQIKALKEVLANKEENFFLFAKQLIALDERFCEVVVDSLAEDGNETTAHILGRLAEEIGGKKLRKLVKKTFYRFSQKGVKCPEIKKAGEPVFKKISLPQPEAHASHIDSTGDRLIILALPQSLQLYATYSFVINDLTGMRDIQEVLLKKKDLISYLKGDDSQHPIAIVEIDYPYAQYLLHRAYQKNIEKAVPLPENFTARHTILINAAPDREPPLIYRFLNEDEIRNNQSLSDYASVLFNTPEIEGWQADGKYLAEYRHKINDLNMSTLVISKVAKEERIESIINEAVRNFFTTELCQTYKHRLEETAYIFWKTGRTREAEISLAAAICLATVPVPIENQIFPQELVRRSLLSQKEEEKVGDSGIIIPNSRVII